MWRRTGHHSLERNPNPKGTLYKSPRDIFKHMPQTLNCSPVNLSGSSSGPACGTTQAKEWHCPEPTKTFSDIPKTDYKGPGKIEKLPENGLASVGGPVEAGRL